ncbi:hypothetical protein PILCRDRAFT_377797 [Piloderma croceum F 1598]|uniref:Uncharacterized protein n=1 Tax=Piloderma croceum (strain F 1598) TaxID=765440 RepID=A0A0C3G2V6_PILCF|nr:hypothetical protein PILCRDRAFT_377797 [Piloderma croceum F 1598]
MSSRTLLESRVGRFTSPPPPAATDTYSHHTQLKVTGVRIDTDNVALWRQSLKPTRATVLPDDDGRLPRPSALNSIANKNIINPSKPIINAPTPMQSRRKQRYTRAEEALAKSLKQRKPSPTAQQLQIRALEQVTALLRLHAQEAQERATKLRGVLAQSRNGGVGGKGKGEGTPPLDPEVIRAMQRERWMEEKRKGVVDCEAEAVREQIVSLSQFGGKSNNRVVLPSQGTTAVGVVVMDEETKRRANNLAKFFELSPTRKPISSRKKSLSSLTSSSSSSSSSYDRAPRRVTMNDAPPMLLRTSIASSFTPYTQSNHARSISLDGGKVGNRSSTASSTRYLGNASLAAVAEDTTGDTNIPVSPIPPTPTLTHALPPSTPTTSSSLPTLPTPPPPKPNFPHRTPTLPTGTAGTATIYTPILRSKADILASMGKQVEDGVEVPRYALDLIGDLDYIPEGISVLCAGAGAGGGVGGGGEREREVVSRNRYFKAGLPNPRSLIRKSSPTTPTPTSTPTTTPTKKQRPRPQSHPHPPNNPLLSNLFSISESSQTTAIPIPIPIPLASHDSTMSLPIPFIRDGDGDGVRNRHSVSSAAATATGALRTSTSTTSSSFEIVHPIPHVPHAQNGSPTKPARQRFSFLGRK